MTKLARIFGTLVLLGYSVIAQGGSVFLSPTGGGTTFQVGDTIVLDFLWDFTADDLNPNGVLGGGTDVSFDDSLLRFDAFIYDSNPAFDPAFTNRNFGFTPNIVTGIATGNFDGLAGDSGGGGGVLLIGTLWFTALDAGVVNIVLSENAFPVGPFVGATTLQALDGVDFTGIDLTITQVPIPAAGWLFLASLSTYFFARRSDRRFGGGFR